MPESGDVAVECNIREFAARSNATREVHGTDFLLVAEGRASVALTRQSQNGGKIRYKEVAQERVWGGGPIGLKGSSLSGGGFGNSGCHLPMYFIGL